MLEFCIRPIRTILGVTEHEVADTIQETQDIEANTLGAVRAIENATESIEKHVTVVEMLATSVDPLRESVDRLTDTVQDLVKVLGPITAAEQEAQRIGHLLRRHRHDEQPQESQAGS
jgi:hypothetical protein